MPSVGQPFHTNIIIIIIKQTQLLSLSKYNAIDPLFHDCYENLLCDGKPDDHDDVDLIETAMKINDDA